MKHMRVSFSSLIGILLSTVCAGTVAASPCATSLSCNFDHDMCGFTSTTVSGAGFLMWRRDNQFDGIQTMEHGYFVHLTTTNILTKDGDGTDMVSPPLCYNGAVCLSFDYLLPGQTTLDILVQTGGQTSKVIALPSTPRWTATNFSLHGTANSRIIFRGTRVHYGSIVAIANMTECSPKPTAHIPDTSKPTTHKPTTHKPTTHKPIMQKPAAPIPYHLFTYTPTTQIPTTPKPTTHKLMSSPDSKSPANTTVTQLAQQTSHNILALKNQNEECMQLNKQGSDSLESETDIFLHIKQKVQIYSSDLQTKLTNLHTTQTLITTDQALLLNEQDLILATSQRLVINVGDPSIFTAPSALLRQLDFIGDQMRLLQNLQDTLKKNNAEKVLLQQEKVLLHRQPGLFQLDTSSLTPEEQLLHQATVLQLQASLLHNDDILTHIDHNMTTCLNQEMITILSLRENLLHYQSNLRLQG
ncbi:uncharacterized protein [Haliotis cracherodii]|uniref:uncharacterized protein isoform X2 n=1 Tax=Haliotis cracherodii TaxID=6455 RepID=UPI0039EA1106